MSGESEQANGRASGPALISGFLVVQDQSAPINDERHRTDAIRRTLFEAAAQKQE